MLPLALWTPTVRICTKPVTRAFHDVFHDETWPADSDEHELHMVMLVCLMFGSFATCTCAPPSNVAVAPGKASTFVGSSKFENVLGKHVKFENSVFNTKSMKKLHQRKYP